MNSKNFLLIPFSRNAGTRFFPWLVFLLALSLLPMALPAALLPELIFKDNFDASSPSDDLNAGAAARQTGKVAPLTYAGRGNPGQLGQADAPNRLRLGSDAYVSPNHNFTEGGKFTIEFDIDPGIDDDPGDGLSADWAAIVFGATTQNVFVNASDGMGILFRNMGDIQVFDGSAASYGGNGDVAGGIPTGQPFHVRIEVEAADFRGGPATVRMFINDHQARLDNSSLEHIKLTGFHANYITLEGLGFPGPWVHVFDNLSITAVPCVQISPQSVTKVAGQTSEPISVKLPAQLNATNPVAITVRTLNPAIGAPTGADASGRLTLNFPAGSSAAQTFTVNAVGGGSTAIVVEGPSDVCVDGRLDLVVSSGVGVNEIVFTDNFNTSAASLDVNSEVNTSRQGGSAKPLSYTEPEASASGGAADEFTQVNNDGYPGKLYIVNEGNGVSPAHNFIEGPEFRIEFEVNPGASNPSRDSDNWAAVVFGSSTANVFVNASDGMGILFRNDGRIEVWDGASRVFGSDLSNALPAGPFNVRIEAKAANFSGTPATISMFVNGAAVPLTATAASYLKQSGFRANYITLEGIGDSLVHTFDDFKVTAQACINFLTSRLDASSGGPQTITIQVPAALISTQDVTVKLTSRNPAMVSPAGAVNGQLDLHFTRGGPITQTVSLNITGKGATLLELSDSLGICVGDPALVSVSSRLIQNPSFESNYNPAYPHYGDIDDWVKTGGTGVNESGGPFHDNGTIPDRSRIAFLQGNASIMQTISGLQTNKQYWIQFFYNARGCCGGTIDETTRFADADLDTIANLKPVGAGKPYNFRNVLFKPGAASGDLQFVTTAQADATALFDAITIVQRDEGNVIVQNPSFEASGEVPAPGYLLALAGWTGTNQFGVNFSGAGPFADNGQNPDQDNVAFLQGASSISQVVPRLVAGESYTLSFAYNARSGNRPHLQVKVANAVVFEEDVTPVGGGNAYHTKSITFVAADVSARVTFSQTLDADQTILLDDIRLAGKSVSLPCLQVTPAKADLSTGQSATVTVTVPPALIASSPATIKLKSANPAVARLTGAAADGSLSLNFAAGGASSQTVTVEAVARGQVTIDVVDAAGLCVDNGINVNVVTSFVRNPSFESNPAGGFPGYGTIDAWTGGSGLNKSGGPFHDNGVIPDREQIAFIQVNGVLSQEIANLTPNKEYWLQFRYNVRNCCGGTIDLTVRFAGNDLGTIQQISPVGGPNDYYFFSAPLTPTASSGALEFATTASGDATVLLDAVNIVQRDANQLLLDNPSFEASGAVPYPGYIQPRSIAGWKGAGSGAYGVNVAGPGPFADNGINPDQDSVAFLQKVASLSQTLSNLTAGKTYTLSYAYNARSGNSPRLKVTVGDAILQDEVVTPVGGTAPYYSKSVVFTATDATQVLTFAQTSTNDNTVVLDNVKLVEGGVAPVVGPALGAQRAGADQVRIVWPVTVIGFRLQSAPQVGGPWTDDTTPASQQGGQNVVTETIGSGNKFYRLAK